VLYVSVSQRDLHSFPTRRSSDLLIKPLRSVLAGLVALRGEVGVQLGPGGVAGLEHVHLLAGEAAAALELAGQVLRGVALAALARSEEHTTELQSREKLVCRLLLE